MKHLGDLEAVVMEILWASPDQLLVRDVLDRMRPDRALAYTTVLTVLDNLHRKGLVRREFQGRAYRYVPVRSRAEHVAALMQDALGAAGGRRDEVLLHFVGDLDQQDKATLRSLLRRRGPPR